MILNGDKIEEQFTQVAQRYRQTKRWQGGDWEASWWIPLSLADEEYLNEWFLNRLFREFQARIGQQAAWQGRIWRMELHLDGVTEVRDVAAIFNALRPVITDEDNEVQELAWQINQPSIDTYLRREELIFLDRVTANEANATAASELAYASSDLPRMSDFSESSEDGLLVQAYGDVVTMNNRFVTSGDGSLGTMSDYIMDIIDTDCDLITPGLIAANSLSRRKAVEQYPRAWDAILQMVEAGDGSLPWRFWVADGKANYQPANPAPTLEWRGRANGFTDTTGKLSAWQIEPGVVRNTRRRRTLPPPDDFLRDGRDAIIWEVEMAFGRAYPIIRPVGFDGNKLAGAVEDNRRWLEDGNGTRDDGYPTAPPGPYSFPYPDGFRR